jgi:hypothetical protein
MAEGDDFVIVLKIVILRKAFRFLFEGFTDSLRNDVRDLSNVKCCTTL